MQDDQYQRVNQTEAHRIWKSLYGKAPCGLSLVDPTYSPEFEEYAHSIFDEHIGAAVSILRIPAPALEDFVLLESELAHISDAEAVAFYAIDLFIIDSLVALYSKALREGTTRNSITDEAASFIYPLVSSLEYCVGLISNSETIDIIERVRLYFKNPYCLASLAWVYFYHDPAAVREVSSAISVINAMLSYCDDGIPLSCLCTYDTLRDAILCKLPSTQHRFVRFLNICGFLSHFNMEENGAYLQFALTSLDDPGSLHASRTHLDLEAALAVFFGMQYKSFYVRLLGATALTSILDTEKVRGTLLYQFLLLRVYDYNLNQSEAPKIHYLRTLLSFRRFEHHDHTLLTSMIYLLQDFSQNQYSAVFYFGFLKLLLGSTFRDVHFYALVDAGILKFFFLLLSEYFVDSIAYGAMLAVQGKKVTNIDVFTGRSSALLQDSPYTKTMDSLSSHDMNTHVTLLSLMFKFFDRVMMARIPLSYLLSPRELNLMSFQLPRNYNSWGCGEHPLTQKGLISTIIDLYITIPLMDSRRWWLSVLVVAIIRGSMCYERCYFARYKLLRYLLDYFRLPKETCRSILAVSSNETMNNFDLLAHMFFRNWNNIVIASTCCGITNRDLSQMIYSGLLNSVLDSAVMIRSIVCSVTTFISDRGRYGVHRDIGSFAHLSTMLLNWYDIISYLLTFKFSHLNLVSVCIVNTAILMLYHAHKNSGYTILEILERVFLYPSLILAKNCSKYRETLTCSDLSIFDKIYRYDVDVFIRCLEDKEGLMHRLERFELKMMGVKPKDMSGGVALQFPWIDPYAYIQKYKENRRLTSTDLIADDSMQSSAFALANGFNSNSETVSDERDLICPTILNAIRVFLCWANVYCKRGRDHENMQFSYLVNSSTMIQFVDDIVDGLFAMIRTNYGKEAHDRMLRMKAYSLQPMLFTCEVLEREKLRD